MTEHFSVRVTKDYLVFSAGHFIVFESNVCERLHGHNYRVSVQVDGPLDASHFVCDFITLRDEALAVVAELDHRMLVPTRADRLTVERGEEQVTIRHGERWWSFPRGDCALLPLASTTAELLARFIGMQLLERLQHGHDFVPHCLSVEVEECFGQSATVRLLPSSMTA